MRLLRVAGSMMRTSALRDRTIHTGSRNVQRYRMIEGSISGSGEFAASGPAGGLAASGPRCAKHGHTTTSNVIATWIRRNLHRIRIVAQNLRMAATERTCRQANAPPTVAG